MVKTKVKLECPKCGFPIVTYFERGRSKAFILFICPDCHSNVVYYNGKTDIVSNELIRKLSQDGRIKIQKAVEVECPVSGRRQPITGEDVSNVKDILEKSSSVDDFLHNIT